MFVINIMGMKSGCGLLYYYNIVFIFVLFMLYVMYLWGLFVYERNFIYIDSREWVGGWVIGFIM